jgi:lipopolysaccharide transport system ATP-binding protein
MGNTALRVESLGKQYLIAGTGLRNYTLASSIMEAFTAPFERLMGSVSGPGGASDRDFWALKDVSFEVKHGEVLAIIGRNGSGKSTLLKIISRVLEPTTGRIVLYGRCGSLLEIGMGFHPELTGRENIYLNGAVLGMKKAEIDQRLNSIIEFSELDNFIDTPVKRYSTGMYVKLAFSVAAQMDSDILIVDEVLSVGDAVFQRKCIQRMQELVRQGRTVLFVSHSMETVRDFCGRAILLREGQLIEDGSADDVVDRYESLVVKDYNASFVIGSTEDVPQVVKDLPSDPAFRLTDIGIFQDGKQTLKVFNTRPILLRAEFEVLEETRGLYLFFRLYGPRSFLLFESLNRRPDEAAPVFAPGRYISTAEIPAELLAAHTYGIWVGAAIEGVRSCLPDTIKIALMVIKDHRASPTLANLGPGGEIAPSIRWDTDAIATPSDDAGMEVIISDVKMLRS